MINCDAHISEEEVEQYLFFVRDNAIRIISLTVDEEYPTREDGTPNYNVVYTKLK